MSLPRDSAEARPPKILHSTYNGIQTDVRSNLKLKQDLLEGQNGSMIVSELSPHDQDVQAQNVAAIEDENARLRAELDAIRSKTEDANGDSMLTQEYQAMRDA